MIQIIPLATRKKIGGGMPIVRIYTLSDRQLTAMRRAIGRTAGDPAAAESRVRTAVARLLAGVPVTEETHPEIVKLSRWFRPLTTADVEALPRTGCPDGWVQALLIPVATRRWTRILRYDLTGAQTVAVNDAIAAVTAAAEQHQSVDYTPRDLAWQEVVAAVTRLLSGQRPTRDWERDLAEHFPALRMWDLVARCDEASEHDVLEHTCRGGR